MPKISQFTIPNWFNNNIVMLPVLAIVTFVLYTNTLHSPFVFDDLHNIIANKPIRITEISITTLSDAAQKSLVKNRPVANISLALNYYFHQYDVTGYHLVNIFIHVINGILLFFLVQFTLLFASGSVPQESKRLIAFSVALLWLVHPLQTQSVTYIIQRMNSMATMFYLSSFICYIRARLTTKKTIRLLFVCGSIAAGILAIGSKENAVMLPVFILLYEWYFFQDLRLHLRKHHYFALAILTLFLLGAIFFYLGPNPLKIVAGYGGRDFTVQERLLTQLRVVVFYISLITLPFPSRLTLEHDFALSHSFFSPMTTLLSLFALVGMILTAVLMAKRYRIVSFCLLWFLGNLLIESSIIPLEIIFEHRTYLPSMMLILLIVLTVHSLIANNRFKTLLFVVAVILLSSWTYSRNSIWKDELSLAADIAQKAPYKSRAQMNYGIKLSNFNRLDEALIYLNRAVQLDPDYELAYYSLGDALMKQNKFIDASESYAKGLQLNPNSTLSRFNLAKALASAGKYNNALFHYQKAVNRDRLINHQVYYHMGNTLYKLRRYDEALEAYNNALRAKPNYYEARQAYNNTRKLIEILNSQQPVNR
jgi:tetratricopeptide (TPR) repeat protein